MFKQVFRLAFVTLIWKQYKHVIVSTLLLFAALFLIGSLHSDYLTHSQLQDDTTGTGLSFIYKWTAFAGVVAAYFLFHLLRGKSKTPDPKTKQEKIIEELAGLEDDEDPFTSIRKRKKLRGRADFIIGGDAKEQENGNGD